jgi:hypothetical protein
MYDVPLGPEMHAPEHVTVFGLGDAAHVAPEYDVMQYLVIGQMPETALINVPLPVG